MRGTAPTIAIGDTFVWLTVESIVNEPGRRRRFVCRCKCGNLVSHTSNNLRKKTNRITSCGCRKALVAREINTIHGMSVSDPLTFTSWQSMIGRTTRSGDPNFRYYGERGIRPCEFLEQSPVNLVSIIGSRPSERHSLDRYPNPRAGYDCGQCDDCKSRNALKNVRWATRSEQGRNKRYISNSGGDRRANRLITAFGKTMLLCEWSELTGLAPHTISTRIDHGKKFSTPELALSTPDRKGNCFRPEMLHC